MQAKNTPKTHEYLYFDIDCKEIDIENVKANKEDKLTDLLIIKRFIREMFAEKLVAILSLDATIDSVGMNMSLQHPPLWKLYISNVKFHYFSSILYIQLKVSS